MLAERLELRFARKGDLFVEDEALHEVGCRGGFFGKLSAQFEAHSRAQNRFRRRRHFRELGRAPRETLSGLVERFGQGRLDRRVELHRTAPEPHIEFEVVLERICKVSPLARLLASLVRFERVHEHFGEVGKRRNGELQLVFNPHDRKEEGRRVFGRQAVAAGVRAPPDDRREERMDFGLQRMEGFGVRLVQASLRFEGPHEAAQIQMGEDVEDRIRRSEVEAGTGARRTLRILTFVLGALHEKGGEAHVLKENRLIGRIHRVERENACHEALRKQGVRVAKRGFGKAPFDPAGRFLRRRHF